MSNPTRPHNHGNVKARARALDHKADGMDIFNEVATKGVLVKVKPTGQKAHMYVFFDPNKVDAAGARVLETALEHRVYIDSAAQPKTLQVRIRGKHSHGMAITESLVRGLKGQGHRINDLNHIERDDLQGELNRAFQAISQEPVAER